RIFCRLSSHTHPPPPSSTPFPCTTLFRSHPVLDAGGDLDLEDALTSDAALTPALLARLAIDLALAPALGAGASHNRKPCQQCRGDRKSTRLNSSHVSISYAVFCLKKKIHK